MSESHKYDYSIQAQSILQEMSEGSDNYFLHHLLTSEILMYQVQVDLGSEKGIDFHKSI